MWRMSEGGEGILTGAQAKLVKLAIAEYAGRLDGTGAWGGWGGDWARVEQVARMGRPQLLHMLATVARALLDPRAPQPPTTADSESAAYQIFMLLGGAVEAEIGMCGPNSGRSGMRRPPPEPTTVRQAISDALREAGCCKDADDESGGKCGRCSWCAPDPECVDPSEWAGALEALADRVLWDRDWEMEGLLADAEPGLADSIKGALAIGGGYFSTPAPEPTAAEATAARAYLESVRAEMLK
jgi:hypothetical protein